jgi:hypothetical protein
VLVMGVERGDAFPMHALRVKVFQLIAHQ